MSVYLTLTRGKGNLKERRIFLPVLSQEPLAIVSIVCFFIFRSMRMFESLVWRSIRWNSTHYCFEANWCPPPVRDFLADLRTQRRPCAVICYLKEILFPWHIPNFSSLFFIFQFNTNIYDYCFNCGTTNLNEPSSLSCQKLTTYIPNGYLCTILSYFYLY